MTLTALVCLLLSTHGALDAAPGSTRSSELVELAETARQNHAACGPLAVWYALARLGHPTDASGLIAAARLNEQGTSIRRLLEMLEEHGCPASAISASKGRLELLSVPAILIVDKGRHCVVYDGIDDARGLVRVFETTNNEVRLVSLRELQNTWTGEAIIFDRPAPSRVAFCAMCLLAASALVLPAACLVFRRGRGRRAARGNITRAGMTLIEVVVTLGIVGVLLAILLPAVQAARESSRAAQCRGNLHQLGIALHNYESQFRVFPPAATWKPAGEPLGLSIAAPGSVDRISLGLASTEQPDRMHANWVIALLPFLDEASLYDAFDLALPVGDMANADARATELPVMMCPSDAASVVDNRFQRSGLAAADAGYARGNYAINGGTNRRCLTRLSSRKAKCQDGVFVNGTDLRLDTSQVLGNGVAGVNRALRRTEFSAGLSKLIFIEEIRAGVHPLDRRGVWALGFPGSSVTACHGLYGNNGPNLGKDAIQGCSETLAQVSDLEQQGMPCLQSRTDSRFEISERATARSTHVGGVNLLMADGSAQFIADSIDKRAWHNLHRRDRQEAVEY